MNSGHGVKPDGFGDFKIDPPPGPRRGDAAMAKKQLSKSELRGLFMKKSAPLSSTILCESPTQGSQGPHSFARLPFLASLSSGEDP